MLVYCSPLIFLHCNAEFWYKRFAELVVTECLSTERKFKIAYIVLVNAVNIILLHIIHFFIAHILCNQHRHISCYSISLLWSLILKFDLIIFFIFSKCFTAFLRNMPPCFIQIANIMVTVDWWIKLVVNSTTLKKLIQ